MRILILHQSHPILVETLIKHGFEVDYRLGLSRSEVIQILPQYQGLVVRSALAVDVPILKAGSNLKFIARMGSGMENIDQDEAKKRNITLLNTPEGNRNAVAEHALGMLLSLLNNLKRADDEVRKGIWKREPNWGTEIEGSTIGIIGFGNTGSSFAKKLYGFDAQILAYDKYKTGFGNQFVQESSLEEIFEKAHILSLHIPLTELTHHLVNSNFIKQFKHKIILINTSRGEIVKTSDLVSALKNDDIKAACLDVFEFEGMSFEQMDKGPFASDFDFLASSDKVLLSPHIAGWTHQSYYKLAQVAANKIIDQFGK